MRRRLFDVWCVVSLLTVAILGVGFVARIAVYAGHTSRSSIRGCDILIDHGNVVCYFESADPTASVFKSAPAALMIPGWHGNTLFRLLPFALPRLRGLIWGFDAQSLTNSASVAGVRVNLVVFPIWCACVPFLTAPAIWLMRWRKSRRAARPAASGFAVVTKERGEI